MKFGYLIDMDGVIYRENRLIPGAVEFVNALLSTGTPFLFLTNNSAPTAEDLTVRLRHLGVNGLSPKHFYTSAMNTADFLAETHPNCSVFVIGEGGLLTALHDYKIANDAIEAFSESGLAAVPIRTWGRICTDAGGLVFRYRPFLVLSPKEVRVEAPLFIGKGLLSPLLVTAVGNGGEETPVARFPPRYRGHGAELVTVLGVLGEREVGLQRGIKAGLAWIRGQFKRRPKMATGLQVVK